MAPYLGVAYGGFDDRLRELAGLRVRWTDEVSSTHLWDGVNLHHLVDWVFDEGKSLGIVAAEQDGTYYLGGTFSIGFALDG